VQRPLPLVLRQWNSLRDAGGLLMQVGESGVNVTLPAGDGDITLRI
jgi:alpha-D-xyloside xylohydrolase